MGYRGGTGTWFKATIFLLTVIFSLAPLAQAKNAKENPHDYQIFGFNDLGMHCYDKDFSVFSLLPPFNTVHAQVIRKKTLKPRIMGNRVAEVTYRGDYSNRYDPSGNLIGQNSITTTSGKIFGTDTDKSNFWTYVGYLFGAFGLPVDVGLTGTKMPNGDFGPQKMKFERSYKWFTAQGIPLTEVDDDGNTNNYPYMKFQAFSPSGKKLGDSLDVVLPLSTEFRCAACHETDSFIQADNDAGIDWVASDASPPPRLMTDTFNADSFSTAEDFQVRFRENILILHDYMNKTTLMTQYQSGSPVLCASCHYSKALDLKGTGPNDQQKGHFYLSQAMHKHHGTAWPMPGGGGMGGGSYVIPIPQYPDVTLVQECYYCHPGNETQCLRSVMSTKFAQLDPQGGCQNCHGGLLAVAGYDPSLGQDGTVTDATLPAINDPKSTQYVVNLTTGPNAGKRRQPWADLPKCQSCHSGDALSRPADQLVATQAYTDANAASASPIMAPSSRFAENNGLYRFSETHGGVACESCHGSTHCEWPAREPSNDNQTAVQIQGHVGEISECGACHLPDLPLSQKGPHGLHNVNDPNWVKLHGPFWAKNAQSCKACHGLDLKGTVFSKAKADREFPYHGQSITFVSGTPVNCFACHQTSNFKYQGN